MSLVHNERTKLFSSFLNSVAAATIVTGIIVPTVGFLYDSGTTAASSSWWWAIGAAWFLVGVGLHIAAHVVLGRLKE